jgi:hypothetical protein
VRAIASGIVVRAMALVAAASLASPVLSGFAQATPQPSPSPTSSVTGDATSDAARLAAELARQGTKKLADQKAQRNPRKEPVVVSLPQSIVERMMVSACISARPDVAGRVPEGVDMCSWGSDTCNEPDTPANERRWYFSVWERDRKGPPDYLQVTRWRHAGYACYRPDNLPTETLEEIPERALTWVDVYNAIRNEKAAQKRVTIQPAGRTLVNADTIVYTSKDKWARYGMVLLGFKVDVEGMPTEYKWDFGDGQTLTTRSAGRPHPAKDVTHKYMKRADQLGVSVTTTYAAKFRVDGGGWQTIEQPLTVEGPTTALDVREAIPVLVDPER